MKQENAIPDAEQRTQAAARSEDCGPGRESKVGMHTGKRRMGPLQIVLNRPERCIYNPQHVIFLPHRLQAWSKARSKAARRAAS